MQHGRAARAEARRPRGLHSHEAHVLVVEEAREEPDRVRPPADACDHGLREPVVRLDHLPPRLTPDHGLQLAHDRGVRSRADARADEVVRRLDVRDPVAYRLTRRLLQGLRAELDGLHLGAEKAHALDVRMLSAHVLGTHVHNALETEPRAYGRRRDAVLPGSGLGHDPSLAEARCKQDLPECVVDLVRARVVEVLALEDDSASCRSEALGLVERRRAPDVALAEPVELRAEGRVGRWPPPNRARARRAQGSSVSGTKRPP